MVVDSEDTQAAGEVLRYLNFKGNFHISICRDQRRIIGWCHSKCLFTDTSSSTRQVLGRGKLSRQGSQSFWNRLVESNQACELIQCHQPLFRSIRSAIFPDFYIFVSFQLQRDRHGKGISVVRR
eukprot:scaffold469_cov160-Amphora_coffeaeformis.AAC.1